MDTNNKYYDLIEKLVKNHKKFQGYEAILDEIVSDVYTHAEEVIKTIDNEAVIQSYLQKIVSTSIITVPKRLKFHNEIKHRIIPTTQTISEVKSEQTPSQKEIIENIKDEHNETIADINNDIPADSSNILETEQSIIEDVVQEYVQDETAIKKENTNTSLDSVSEYTELTSKPVEEMINSIGLNEVLTNTNNNQILDKYNNLSLDNDTRNNNLEEDTPKIDFDNNSFEVDSISEQEQEKEKEKEQEQEQEKEKPLENGAEQLPDDRSDEVLELSEPDNISEDIISLEEDDSINKNSETSNELGFESNNNTLEQDVEELTEELVLEEPDTVEEETFEETFEESSPAQMEEVSFDELSPVQTEETILEEFNNDSIDNIEAEQSDTVLDIINSENLSAEADFENTTNGIELSLSEPENIIDITTEDNSVNEFNTDLSDSVLLSSETEEDLTSFGNDDMVEEQANDDFEINLVNSNEVTQLISEDVQTDSLFEVSDDINMGLPMEQEDLLQEKGSDELFENTPLESETIELGQNNDSDYIEEDNNKSFKLMDYSAFSYTPSQQDSNIDDTYIGEQLLKLQNNKPDLNILKIFELKYKQNMTISKIAEELQIDKKDVVLALDELIKLV